MLTAASPDGTLQAFLFWVRKLAFAFVPLISLLGAKCNAVPIEWVADTSDHFAIRFNFEYVGPGLWDIVRPPSGERSPSELWAYNLSPSGRNPGTGPLYETSFLIVPTGTSDMLRFGGRDIEFGTAGSAELFGNGELAATFQALFTWDIAADGSGYMMAEGTRNVMAAATIQSVPEGGSVMGMFVMVLAGLEATRRRLRS